MKILRNTLLILGTLALAYVSADGQNTLAGNLTVQKTVKWTGILTPSQLTSNTDNYAPASFADNTILRISSDATRDLTGIVPGASQTGRLIYLTNVGSNTINLRNESASSTAANRFALGVDFALNAGITIGLWYDGTSSRWRPQGNITVTETGTVSGVSVVTANGVSGSVANPTTTPAITLTLGAITPSSINGVVLSGTSTPTLSVSGTTSVSGTNTGDQTSVTGNAGTATALQTARNINGVAFDGTQNITVTAAAGTLTGTTLAAGVVNSSLLTAAGGTFGTAAFTDATAYEAPLTFSSPLSRSVNAVSIANAAADGSTKGAASFTAADFDASSGLISLDYTNGQAASGSTKGFLTSADWTNFDSKQPGDAALTALAGGSDFVAFSGPATTTKTFTLPNASATIYTTASTSAYTALPFTLASGTLLGRTTALAGTVEEITPGSSLNFASGALNTIQDIRPSASPTFAGLTLSSPLSAANGGTGLSSLGSGVATFLGTPSSANLRSALTDEVGTGAAYFVGGALGTPASGTVTNLTGTASININGTVGATTPSTGVFTDVSGTTSVYAGNTGFALASGTTDGIYMLPVGALVSSRDGQRSLAIRRRNSDGEAAAFFRDTSQVGNISVTTTATAYNTSSDRRLKTNIRDFKSSGPIFEKLKPRIFDWKTGEKDTVGFVAQELYEVYPLAVTKGDDNKTKIKDQWAVDYSKLVPILVAEIQSLRARVEELEKLKLVLSKVTTDHITTKTK